MNRNPNRSLHRLMVDVLIVITVYCLAAAVTLHLTGLDVDVIAFLVVVVWLATSGLTLAIWKGHK